MRVYRGIALAVLCLFAVAALHQVLPHHDEHSEDTCALCALLTSVIVLLPAFFLFLELAARPLQVSIRPVLLSAPFLDAFSRRGPPLS